jgi:hypothetical protein
VNEDLLNRRSGTRRRIAGVDRVRVQKRCSVESSSAHIIWVKHSNRDEFYDSAFQQNMILSVFSGLRHARLAILHIHPARIFHENVSGDIDELRYKHKCMFVVPEEAFATNHIPEFLTLYCGGRGKGAAEYKSFNLSRSQKSELFLKARTFVSRSTCRRLESGLKNTFGLESGLKNTFSCSFFRSGAVGYELPHLDGDEMTCSRGSLYLWFCTKVHMLKITKGRTGHPRLEISYLSESRSRGAT